MRTLVIILFMVFTSLYSFSQRAKVLNVNQLEKMLNCDFLANDLFLQFNGFTNVTTNKLANGTLNNTIYATSFNPQTSEGSSFLEVRVNNFTDNVWDIRYLFIDPNNFRDFKNSLSLYGYKSIGKGKFVKDDFIIKHNVLSGGQNVITIKRVS